MRIDPECEIVRMYHDSLECLFPALREIRLEIAEEWERKHIKVCERCRDANCNHS